MRPNAKIICFEGCTIARTFGNGINGVIGGEDLSNVTWIGGRFTVASGIATPPLGNIFDVTGNDILLQDIVIEGWKNGSAFAIRGDRITLINPRTIAPDPLDADGIRVTAGTGFRCYGGHIESGGDASLQFSTSPQSNNPIIDGAYIGTSGLSHTGRFLLVGTANDAIRNVRFIRCSGIGGEGANCIKVQNVTRTGSDEAPISDVLFRDCEITCQAGTMEAVVILNELTGPNGTVSNIRFENLVIRGARATAFRVNAANQAGVNFVDGVYWSRGAIYRDNPSNPAISLKRLNNAAFESIRIVGAPTGPAVIVGDGDICSNVVLSDITLLEVSADEPGILFDEAINCGWKRGVIASTAAATAAIFGAGAQGCYIEGANLSGIGPEPKITAHPAATYRLTANYGSAQRTPVNTGVPTRQPLAATRIAIDSSSSAIALPSGTTGTLKTIDGGRAGDLIIVTIAVPGQINVNDSTGNLRLKGQFPMTAPADTLTAIRHGSDWLEIARGDNG